MIVLGIDPGFASLGWAAVQLLPGSEKYLALGVIETEKSDKKLRVLSSDDNMRRTREIAVELRRVIEAFGPTVLCLEAMSFARHAAVANKIGMARGAVATAALLLGDVPIVEASPQQIKQVLCGCKDASKAEVQTAAIQRFGPGVSDDLARIKKSLREHPADALGAIVACLDSEVVRMGRRIAS